MALPPNIKPPDPRRGCAAGCAIVCAAAGVAGFFLFDGLAFVLEGQDTVSELAWSFLDWGPASYVLVGGIFAAIVGWAAVHLFGKGRLG